MLRVRGTSLARRRWMSTEIYLPSASSSGSQGTSQSDPSTSNSSTSIALSSHPRANAYNDPPRHSDLPTPPQTIHPKPTPAFSSMNPPFHTHTFFSALEKSFPTPIARTLMRATRAMLMNKVGRARREGLGKKDLENQAYLFRAAMSELRNDTAMRIRNETAAINTSTAALRREVDSLSAHMKEALANLRHENQMEVDNRKNEARTDLKKQALAIENIMSKSMIQLGELRTEMERMRWMNMYRSILSLAAFAAMIVLYMEITRRQAAMASSPPHPPAGITASMKQPESEDLADSNYVT